MRELSRLVRAWSSISPAAILRGLDSKQPKKIVDIYGDNTIDKILENPDKLQSISGLSAKNREAFISTLRLNYGTEMVLAKLANYGIPNKLAFQIQDFTRKKR